MSITNFAKKIPNYLNVDGNERLELQEGTKDFAWTRFQPTNSSTSSINTAQGQISFNQSLSDAFYHLPSTRLVVNLQLSIAAASNVQAGTVVNYAATDYVALVPDSLFQTVSAQINSTEIADTYGKLQTNHIKTHLLKLMSYNPTYANQIAYEEYFFMDGGATASANLFPNKMFARVATVPQFATSNNTIQLINGLNGGLTNNIIVVGSTAPNGVQPATGVDSEVFQANTATGNPYFYQTTNPAYNASFDKRVQLCTTSQPVSFTVPLKYLYPEICSIPRLENSFNFSLTLTTNPVATMLFSGSQVAVGTVYIQSMYLDIPAYHLNPTYEAQLVSSYLQKTSERNYYIDWALVKHPVPIQPGTTNVNAVWTSIIKRPPVAAFVFMIYDSDSAIGTGNQNGNPYRLINFQPTSDTLTIANTYTYPNGGGRQVVNNSYQVYYDDYKKVQNILYNYGSQMIDYKTFISHKFFIPYDLRDKSDAMFVDATSPSKDMSISINIPSSAIIATTSGNAATGDTQGGQASLYVLLGTVNSTEINRSPNQLSIRPNIGFF
jgi:hypothetical protein